MGNRDLSPFPTPDTKDWQRSVRRELRERGWFYKWLTILLIVIPIPYLVFTWATSHDETERLKPDTFFMVSYADVHEEVERIANEWDSKAELEEARFFVWPYIGKENIIDARILYSGEEGEIVISVAFLDGLYDIRPQAFFAGNSSSVFLEPGTPSSLPPEFVFADNLLAFDQLLELLGPQMTEDYLDVDWPALLIFTTDAPEPLWQLCYRLRNSDKAPTCADSSGLDYSQ